MSQKPLRGEKGARSRQAAITAGSDEGGLISKEVIPERSALLLGGQVAVNLTSSKVWPPC